MSRFVPAGTLGGSPQGDDEWSQAQKEVEDNKRREEEEGRQEGGKSLYEVRKFHRLALERLQSNLRRFYKPTKSIKLKNQFKTLDEDDVDFLDKVLESTRAQDASVQKETTEQLEIFRKQRDQAKKMTLQQAEKNHNGDEEEKWIAGGRKRKKGRDKEGLPGIKIRRLSSKQDNVVCKAEVKSDHPVGVDNQKVVVEEGSVQNESDQKEGAVQGPISEPSTAAPATSLLGLDEYSDE